MNTSRNVLTSSRPVGRFARYAALGAIGALALAACSTDADDAMESDDAMTEEATSPTPSHDATDDAMEDDSTDESGDDGAMAALPDELNFTAATVSGGTFDGTAMAGVDAIFWFWAPWCPSCRAEAPAVGEALAEFPDDVMFYGVAGRDTVEASQAFVDSYAIDGVEHIFDEDGSVWAGFGVTSQPAFALVNDDGTVEIISGAMGADGILEAAADLASR